MYKLRYFLASVAGGVIVCFVCEILWFNHKQKGICSCQSERLVWQCAVCAIQRTHTSVKRVEKQREHRWTHVSEHVCVSEEVQLCCSLHTNDPCPPPISPLSQLLVLALKVSGEFRRTMKNNQCCPIATPLPFPLLPTSRETGCYGFEIRHE